MIPVSLQGWAARWSVGNACLADLLQSLGVAAPPVAPPDPSRTSEGYVQSLVRLEAPRYGVHLWRNNVGVAREKDEATGKIRPVRYGLANDSKDTNSAFKSGDLIGWRARTITVEMVGTTMAQFISRECKRADWKWSGSERERAQLAWIGLITRAGGDAKFVKGEGSFDP